MLASIIGSVAFMVGLGVAMAMSATFGRQMGDVACAWRVSYSPGSRAYSIWGIIFLWAIASVGAQLCTALDLPNVYAADPHNNVLEGLAFLAAGLWVLVFSWARDHDARAGLAVSASFLVSSTTCAIAACVQERSWGGLQWQRIVWVGVPFALFAGWMLVATSLGMGVAYLALAGYPPDNRCLLGGDGRKGVIWTPSDAGVHSWTPLVLSAVVTSVAVLLPDPVLPVPLLWAVCNMHGHTKNYVALGVLVAGVVAASVCAAMDIQVGGIL